MLYLFLETNSFIEFQPFESIKWSEVCGNNDFTIVISPIVIREINKHKDNTKGKKRERARKARKRINEIAKGTSPSRFNVEFCKDPSRLAFENPLFNKEIADDWLIFSTIEFSADNDSKIIVTNDTGIYLVAKEFGIRTIEIPEKYLAPSDPTDEVLQIKDLKRRLQEFEESLPHVILSFAEGQNTLSLKRKEIPNMEGVQEAYKEELRIKYPYKYKNKNPLTLINISESILSEKDYEKYNSQIEPYIEDEAYNMFLRDVAKFVNESVVPLHFELNNIGSIPSGFLGVRLKFSEGATILKYEESKSYFKLRDTVEPILKSALLPSFDINMYAPLGTYYNPIAKDNSIVIWDLEKAIDTSESFFVECKPVVQNMPPISFAREEYFVYLGNDQEFEIEWEIIDSKRADVIKGKLKVAIE